MLKIASEMCVKQKKQYIINMNYDIFDNIVEAAQDSGDDLFAKQIRESVRLKLYDTSPQDKLLGIQIK